MKKYLAGVLTGALVSAIVLGTALSALAISGRMTIEIDPINVQVNGQVFSPTDANGREVPVFAYNGTTYAPLRALAEAYGLEVGYDKERNMATVGKTEAKTMADAELTIIPDDTAKTGYSFDYSYEEFKGLWDITKSEENNGPIDVIGKMCFVAKNEKQVKLWFDSVSLDVRDNHIRKLVEEETDGLLGDRRFWSCYFQYNQTGASWFINVTPLSKDGKIFDMWIDNKYN